MTVSALVFATFLSQAQPTTQDAKPAVPEVTFPSGGPFGRNTPTVLIGTSRVAVAGTGRIDRPYLVDGGWGDFKELYSKVDQSTTKPAYRLKVIVFDDTTVLQKSPAGVVRQRRTVIDGPDLADLRSGLATFEAMLEGSLGGKVDVKLDLQTEGDPFVVETEAGKEDPPQAARLDIGTDPTSLPLGSFGARFVYQNAIPCFNNDLFETDDKVYRGPYAGVFVVHGGLAGRTDTFLSGSTPLSVVPLYRTGDQATREAFPAVLYECWKRQLVVKASGLVSAQTPIELSRTPVPWWGPTVERLALEPTDPAAWTLEDVQGPVVKKDGRTAVRIELADTLFRTPSGSKPVAWSFSPSGVYAEFESAPSEDVPTFENVEYESVQPAVPFGSGSFECSQLPDSGQASAFEIKVKGRVLRGFARVFSGLVPPDAKYLNASVKLSADESVALRLVGTEGQELATVLLGGDSAGPVEQPGRKGLFDAAVPADDQFHAVSVPIGGLIAGHKAVTILFGPAEPGACERTTRGTATFTVSGLALAPAPVEVPKAEPASLKALELAAIQDTPDAEDLASLKAGLSSQDTTEKLTALSVLTRVKDVGSIPALAEAVRSAYVPVAFLAARALAFQGTTDALAELRATVEKGPFDHNQGFAAAQIAPLADPAMVKSLNFLAVRNREARLESVRALTLVKSPLAGAVLSTMLMTEPDPVVKTEIARRADTGIDLVARRLLFAAVNDPSEVVRASAYARLIDVKDPGLQSEALKGVKDDSPTVRTYLLDVMRLRAKEAYRPALRSAVVDTDPRVRAMALRAFATQPGPVQPDEVRNAFSDPDPLVKKALEELAKAKGFPVTGG
ncbi:MAG: hypothetical protein JST30_07235 [Armatimonadetes bacterium]|nr:hypothetical protein [Armatimonadota bacterium]